MTDPDDTPAWGKIETLADLERCAREARERDKAGIARQIVETLLGDGLSPQAVRALAVPMLAQAMHLYDERQRVALATLERKLLGASVN